MECLYTTLPELGLQWVVTCVKNDLLTRCADIQIIINILWIHRVTSRLFGLVSVISISPTKIDRVGRQEKRYLFSQADSPSYNIHRVEVPLHISFDHIIIFQWPPVCPHTPTDRYRYKIQEIDKSRWVDDRLLLLYYTVLLLFLSIAVWWLGWNGALKMR